MSAMNTPPKHICIIRLSAIGDCVNAVSAIQAIQHQWPTTQITWIIGTLEATLLTGLPGVNFVPFDKKKGWMEYFRIWRLLSKCHFDAVLLLQTALRASLISLGLKVSIKIGFHRSRAADLQWLFSNVKAEIPIKHHVVDNFFSVIQKLGIDPSIQPKWHIPIELEDQQWAASIIKNQPTVIISPAASKSIRNWTINGYKHIAEYAIKNGYQVILCGGKSLVEQQQGQDIVNSCEFKSLINMIGKTSLKQLFSLMSQAVLVISPDSGPAHMANAANTRVLGLYADQNPARTGPYNYQKQTVSVYELLSNSDIKGKNWRKRLKRHDAMEKITIESVISAFDLLTAMKK